MHHTVLWTVWCLPVFLEIVKSRVNFQVRELRLTHAHTIFFHRTKKGFRIFRIFLFRVRVEKRLGSALLGNLSSDNYIP